MGLYLIERYLPDVGLDGLQSLSARLASASAQLCAAGTPVRYLDSTFVPDEESCFCRLEAPSTQVAALVNALAEAPYARISAAITPLAHTTGPEAASRAT